MKGWIASFMALAAAASLIASCSPSDSGDDDDGVSFTPTPTPSPLPNNGSLSFDGIDDFVRGNEAVELNDLSALTVEAWVKPAAATGDRVAVAKLSAATRQSWALVRSNSGTAASTIGGSAIDCAVDAGVQLPVGVWTHVAMTWNDGGQIPKIFVNGVLEQTATCSTGIAWVLSPLGIGAAFENDGAVVTQYWAGLIDEVRIWKVERTAAQILAQKNSSLNTATNLLASFRFEEGSGSTTAGGSVVNGTLGGTTAADASDPAWSTDTPF